MSIDNCIAPLIGTIPNRLALAGGWIDQPFVSMLNPDPPGSMVVVSLVPNFRVMERSGCATGTRVGNAARQNRFSNDHGLGLPEDLWH